MHTTSRLPSSFQVNRQKTTPGRFRHEGRPDWASSHTDSPTGEFQFAVPVSGGVDSPNDPPARDRNVLTPGSADPATISAEASRRVQRRIRRKLRKQGQALEVLDQSPAQNGYDWRW